MVNSCSVVSCISGGRGINIGYEPDRHKLTGRYHTDGVRLSVIFSKIYVPRYKKSYSSV